MRFGSWISLMRELQNAADPLNRFVRIKISLPTRPKGIVLMTCGKRKNFTAGRNICLNQETSTLVCRNRAWKTVSDGWKSKTPLFQLSSQAIWLSFVRRAIVKLDCDQQFSKIYVANALYADLLAVNFVYLSSLCSVAIHLNDVLQC